MSIKILLAALLLAVPACAAEPGTDAESGRANLQIEAGRLGAMMSEGGDAVSYLHARAEAGRSEAGESDTPDTARAVIYESLVSAVLRYNDISHQACHNALVDANLCQGPYLPDWLATSADYNDAQLREMTDSASARLMPFWNAICARAEAAGAERPVCPME